VRTHGGRRAARAALRVRSTPVSIRRHASCPREALRSWRRSRQRRVTWLERAYSNVRPRRSQGGIRAELQSIRIASTLYRPGYWQGQLGFLKQRVPASERFTVYAADGSLSVFLDRPSTTVSSVCASSSASAGKSQDRDGDLAQLRPSYARLSARLFTRGRSAASIHKSRCLPLFSVSLTCAPACLPRHPCLRLDLGSLLRIVRPGDRRVPPTTRGLGLGRRVRLNLIAVQERLTFSLASVVEPGRVWSLNVIRAGSVPSFHAHHERRSECACRRLQAGRPSSAC